MNEKIDGHHLRFKDLLRLSVRVFKTRPARTLLTILGMSVGIGAVLFLVSLGYGLQFILLGRLVLTEDSLITLDASYPSEAGLVINHDGLQDFLKIPNVEEVSAIAEFPGEIRADGNSGLIIAKIITPKYFRLSGAKPDIGNKLNAEDRGIILSSQAAKIVNVPVEENSLGKEIDLTVFYQSEAGVSVEQAGADSPSHLQGFINDDLQPPFVLIVEKNLSPAPPFFKNVLVKAKNAEVLEEVRDALIEKGFLISARVDLVNQAQKILTIITVVLGVFGVTALVVSAIGMFNTMIIGFLERIYEVGIMKSLGAGERDIRNLFLMESVLMGLSGAIGGIILGYGAGQGVNLLLDILARRLGGQPVELFITPLWFVVAVIILSALIGLVSGFWPSRRASYLSPKEAFINK